MTSVHVHLYEGDGTTGATGYVLATPTTRRDLSAGGVALPVGKAYTLVDGEATMTLAPSGLTWCWEIREMTAAGTTRYISVVDSPTTVEYEDCADVDPTTLVAWSPASPEAAYLASLGTAVDDYLTENPPSSTLSGVSDGTLGTPSTGDAPVWNGTTQRWEKVSLPSTYVAIPAGIADGEVPTWDEPTQTWIPGTGGSGGATIAVSEDGTGGLVLSSDTALTDDGSGGVTITI